MLQSLDTESANTCKCTRHIYYVNINALVSVSVN